MRARRTFSAGLTAGFLWVIGGLHVCSLPTFEPVPLADAIQMPACHDPAAPSPDQPVDPASEAGCCDRSCGAVCQAPELSGTVAVAAIAPR